MSQWRLETRLPMRDERGLRRRLAPVLLALMLPATGLAQAASAAEPPADPGSGAVSPPDEAANDGRGATEGTGGEQAAEAPILPMPVPAAVATSPSPPPRSTSRGATGQGFGVSFDIAQLLSFAGRFRVDYAPRRDLHVALLLGGGSPDRENLDRYSLMEAGAQGAFFFWGDRMRGVGVVGQGLIRSADGERHGSSIGSLPPSQVSGSAWMAHGGLMTRIAARSGIFLEVDALYGYTHSEGRAVQGENSRSTTVAYLDSRFSIYFGWMQ